MSRVFIGVAHGAPGNCDVYVEQDGSRQRLTRRVQRVHEGYRWDQAGPRSTELARAMLWIVTEAELPWAYYRGFAFDVLANLPLPPCEGECWRLREAEIRTWLTSVGWANTNPENVGAVQAGAPPKPALPWQKVARRVASLFRRRIAAGSTPVNEGQQRPGP